ncbi:MAG: hypothetical protein CMO26_18855 [Thiotrichales bacterium]|nr:hypothetical protein [Thiotrichales bacterium]|tara:strand:- start:395 stop:1147 length:753 start_codon:yes stop_codon:yes gene_type:complete
MSSTSPDMSEQEWALRVDLAAAFRLCVEFGWHESVGNHFSATLSEDGRTFLLNPKWKHFSTIKASDLLKVCLDDEDIMTRPDAPDPSAWCVHGSIHAAVPQAKVLLHCHPIYATTLCMLEDPSILPLDTTTGRFFSRVKVDLDCGGQADSDAEGKRIASTMGNYPIMMMGNHGVSVTGQTVWEAFEDLYFLERASQLMVLAHSTGKPLNVMPDDIAQEVADGWRVYWEAGKAHFEHLKSTLDARDPSYAH